MVTLVQIERGQIETINLSNLLIWMGKLTWAVFEEILYSEDVSLFYCRFCVFYAVCYLFDSPQKMSYPYHTIICLEAIPSTEITMPVIVAMISR